MINLVRVFGLTVVSMAVACGTAQAGFFVGSIDARFENPVLTGAVIQPNGIVYQNFDNTSSAVYSAYEDGPTAVFTWGSNAGAPGMSILTFFPNQSVAVADNVEFQLGTVTFYNGTSTLESLVFGADLVLDFIPAGGGPAVDTLTIPVGIGTTVNVGDAAGNADFVGIPGIANVFFTYEGFGATALVNGMIVGDPYFSLESFTVVDNFILYTGPPEYGPYDPNNFTTYDSPGFAGGFTGPTPTPEPSSIVLLVTGVFSFLGMRSVRRWKKSS
jgi:hypothetical protein